MILNPPKKCVIGEA
uniref:Uncharacterized protein n=1 Tax=Arundo donax TaxID=35708 RepID=A0A0A8Z103_ARUDO